MLIGQVAAEAGVNVPTLRYYERRGLLPAPTRRPSGYRAYTSDAVAAVRFVKRAQQLGFSLDEIETLLHLAGGTDADTCARARALATSKIEEMDQQMARLESMRTTLERLVDTCGDPAEGAEGSESGCPILRTLEEDR